MQSKKGSKKTERARSRTTTKKYRDAKDLIEFALLHGASDIRIGDIEISFSPKRAPYGLEKWLPDTPPNLRDLVAPEASGVPLPQDSENGHLEVISGNHDAESYAQQSDTWASQTRLPRR